MPLSRPMRSRSWDRTSPDGRYRDKGHPIFARGIREGAVRHPVGNGGFSSPGGPGNPCMDMTAMKNRGHGSYEYVFVPGGAEGAFEAFHAGDTAKVLFEM